MNLTVGFSSIFAHRFELIIGKRGALIIIILLLSLAYFSSGIYITYAGISFLFLFYLIRGIASPVLKNYINQYTESEVRATILSVRNFVIRIIFAVLGPFLGWLTDNYSLKIAFIMAGLFYVVSSMIVVLPWIKEKNQKEKPESQIESDYYF